MKEYIKGDKRLRVQAIGTDSVRMDLWVDDTHTYYYKPLSEYRSFLDYLLVVWLKVKRG